MPLIQKEMYEFGPFSLDPVERVISRDGVPLSLTPKAFDTLLCLVRNPGRLLTKDELLKEIWPDTFVEEVNLAVNVSTLRKMLGENPQEPRYIATVPGRGYRFVAEVRQAAIEIETEPNPVQVSDTERVLAPPTPNDASAPLTGSLQPRRDPVPPGRALEADGAKTDDAARALQTVVANGRTLRWAIPVLVGLLLLVVSGGYWRFEQKRRAVPVAMPVSIAVLPFADLSPGQGQEYFSDGLAAELINYLAKVPSVRVVARSSSFQFKGKNEDLRVVGRKLGVANILEGSVQRDGDRIRIMAELVKVDDGFQLWSETYDRRTNDALSVEDEIARAATGALQVKLLDASGAPLSGAARVSNPEAYQAYLQAQVFFGSGEDRGNFERALASADEAIRRDPNYASAWALRSYVRTMMATYNMTDVAEGFAQARQDAEHAIALDARLATGYLALGWIEVIYDWDWEHAEASLNRAAALEPGNVEVLRYRSALLRILGRQDESIELYRKVVALDPLRPRSYSSLGSQLYYVGRYDEANAMVQKALELNPQKNHDHFTSGEILLAQGRPQPALAEMEQEPNEIWRPLGEAMAYHALSQPKESEAALQKLIAVGQKDSAYQIAEVYAYRGEIDQAFAWLDRAFQQRDGGLMFVKIDPLLQNLRHDPRYGEILKKMHLPL